MELPSSTDAVNKVSIEPAATFAVSEPPVLPVMPLTSPMDHPEVICTGTLIVASVVAVTLLVMVSSP